MGFFRNELMEWWEGEGRRDPDDFILYLLRKGVFQDIGGAGHLAFSVLCCFSSPVCKRYSKQRRLFYFNATCLFPAHYKKICFFY